MGISHRMSRREFGRVGAASVAALAFPLPAFAQSAARVVVIGGGVSNEGEPLFSPLREKVREILPGDKTPIVRALLGSDAGIIGAALAAM